MTQKINAVLTEADATAIQDAIAEIDGKMPFLQAVPLADKKKRQKMGDNATSYVNKGLSTARNHTGILRRDFDDQGYDRSNALIHQLLNIRSNLATLAAKLDDTIMLLGEDLMEQTNEVYACVKREAKTNNSLKPVADEMGQFYKKRNQPDKTAKASVSGKTNALKAA